MKNRILWLAVAVAVFATAYFFVRRPAASARVGGGAGRTLPPLQARSVAPAPAASLSAPVSLPAPESPVTTVTPVAPVARKKAEYPKPVVPIQDGATIDFSIGAPVVRSGGADTEALERSLKEMARATKDTTFPPPAKPAPEPAPRN